MAAFNENEKRMLEDAINKAYDDGFEGAIAVLRQLGAVARDGAQARAYVTHLEAFRAQFKARRSKR